MLIRDILNTKSTTLSCELFPPKQGTDLPRAYEIVQKTAQLGPDFMSITYGASGNTSKNTLKIASRIQACGVNALAHLTCVSANKADLDGILSEMERRGIQNVLALRGDLPEGITAPSGDCYQHANELVKAIKLRGNFCIGAACYPEGHVESSNQTQDIEFLKAKVDAGCDFLTTQMFFDNDVLYRFMYKLHAKNVTVPVLAGIMPVTNKKQIGRIVKLSGAVLPPRFLSILDRFGDDDQAMEQAGIAYTTEQIIDLIANGVRGVHIYTMNRPDIAGRIIGNLSCILKAS